MFKPGLKKWMEIQLDSGKYSGLKWRDKNKRDFMISWKHGSRRDWKQSEDASLFKDWAVHKNKFHEGKFSNARKWKSNFRCALEQSKYFIRCEDQEKLLKAKDKFRIYRFAKENEMRGNNTKSRRLNKRKADEKPSTKSEPILNSSKEENKKIKENDFKDQLKKEPFFQQTVGKSEPENFEQVDNLLKRARSTFDVYGNNQPEWKQSDKVHLIDLVNSLLTSMKAKYYDVKSEEYIMPRSPEWGNILEFLPVSKDCIKTEEKYSETIDGKNADYNKNLLDQKSLSKKWESSSKNENISLLKLEDDDEDNDNTSEYSEYEYIYDSNDESEEDSDDEENGKCPKNGSSGFKPLYDGFLEEDTNNNCILFKDIENIDEILFPESMPDKKFRFKDINEEPILRQDIPSDLIQYLDANNDNSSKLLSPNSKLPPKKPTPKTSIIDDTNRSMKLSFLSNIPDKLITLINF